MTEKRKSIVLVTVDCLRADHCGFMGYQRPTTPYLDSLAAKSIVFPAAIVAGAPTYYSFPAILAARYPLALGRDVLGLGPDEPTLASACKGAGYATAAFGAANPYISARFGYGLGFDTFRDFLVDAPAPLEHSETATEHRGVARRLNRRLQRIRPAMGPLRMVYDELYFRYCQRSTPVAASLGGLRRFPSADVIVDDACQWLTSIGDAPCFLWLHLMDPHSPYYPKEEALALLGSRLVTPYEARYLNSYWNRSDLGPARLARRREEVVALYDAGIRWVDVQMARLTQLLKELNRWDDCVFAFTGDHGEEFLDHGGRYHPPSRLMEELIHVPLLLRTPGAGSNTKPNEDPFSLIHLAPTLLDAAQLPVPPEFQGRSYWRQAARAEGGRDIAISESVANCTNPFRAENRLGPRVLSVRESRFKLMLFFDPPEVRLYDLAADPGEESPLAPTAQRAVRRRLLEIAREHIHRSVEQRNWQSRVQARLQELRLEWNTPPNDVSAVAS